MYGEDVMYKIVGQSSQRCDKHDLPLSIGMACDEVGERLGSGIMNGDFLFCEPCYLENASLLCKDGVPAKRYKERM